MKSGKSIYSFLAIFLSDEVDIITLKCYTYGAVYCSLAELENDLQHCIVGNVGQCLW